MIRILRAPVLASTIVAVALVAAGCSNDAAAKPKSKPVRTTTTAAPATSSTTTVPPAPTGTPAPLTGLATSPVQASLITRPALAIKIDNSPEALPQSGVNNTDLVFEIQVEGISRLMAVFNSANASSVGPTRSARYSDPAILAMFGRPLFGWSGANDGVTKAVESANWIVNVNWNQLPKEYHRSSSRPAPHNLYTDTNALFAHAQPGQAAPKPVFSYLAPGEANASASPLAGVNEKVGTTPSTWVWDAATSSYKRWEYGKRHGTTDAGQVAATNVVLLATKYSSGPVAITTGSGQALVLLGGNQVAGTWTRASQDQPYTLTAADGTPIKLNPGRTWIELANNPWGPVDPGAAAGLLGGA